MTLCDVVVIHSSEVFTAGLRATLEAAGYTTTADLEATTDPSPDDRPVVVLAEPDALRAAEAERIDRPRRTVPYVAILDALTATAVSDAIADGFTSVVESRDLISSITAVLDVAATGRSVLPTDFVNDHLVASVTAVPPGSDLHPDELRYLRSLSTGMTVSELALTENHSERTMYRLLSRLWDKLGVPNREQALITAAESGWLRHDGPTSPTVEPRAG